MTNRVNALTVILDDNVREDDVAPLAEAIRQLRGVSGVSVHVVDNMEAAVQNNRVKGELLRKILEVLR